MRFSAWIIGTMALLRVYTKQPRLLEDLHRAQDAAFTDATPAELFFGPRFFTSNRRIRSSSSAGAYAPLGRKISALVSLSYILIFPLKRMAGVSGEISLIRFTNSAPSMSGIIRSLRTRSMPP